MRLASAFGWIGLAVSAGAALGVIARAAMRVVAWQAAVEPEFSWGGSLEVVLFGVIIGAPVALLVWACRYRFRLPSGIGVLAGVALFVVLAVWPPPAATSAMDGTGDARLATAAAFLGAFIAYGALVDTLWHLKSSPASRLMLAFAGLVMAQGAHSVEEYIGRLWESFPPAAFLTGLVSSDRELGFLVINIALVGFGFWCLWWPIRNAWPSGPALAWAWVAIEIINGVVHPVWSVRQAAYTPGVLTAPILLGLALYLAVQLNQRAQGDPPRTP